MSIVELIDVHAGFTCITSRITTRNKTKLLCIITFITFFLSAILDNLTTDQKSAYINDAIQKKIDIENVEKQKECYGKGASLGVGLVTAFGVIAIVSVIIYKIYGAKTADISLPGGFKFKFTT